MNEMITWNEIECDSVNGYGMQVHYSFTSFDKSEIDRVKKWCESHIHAGVKLENLTFREETGSMNLLDKIRAEIDELWKNEPCAIECGCLDEILQIIDKYKAESEE